MRRYAGLDGLRGLAALVVLFGHCLVTDQTFTDTWLGRPVTGWHAVLTYSPLHLLWAGTEAVTVFFVLSGFVLVLPFLDAPLTARWLRYYPQRLIRLLLPIWAAVVLAVAVTALVPRTTVDVSSWLAGHAGSLTSANVRQALEVVRGSNGLNTALWSMQWEVLFSLLLPAYVLGAVAVKRLWWLGLAGAAATAGYGAHMGSAYVQLLAMFAVGSCLAVGRTHWHGWWRRASGLQVAALAVVSLLLVNARWTYAWTATHASALPLATALSLLGAAGLICLFTATRAGVAVGTARPVAALGRISFSLYLVHEPIVVSLGQARLGVPATLILAVPLALLAGFAFWFAVERPSHRLARRVTRW